MATHPKLKRPEEVTIKQHTRKEEGGKISIIREHKREVEKNIEELTSHDKLKKNLELSTINDDERQQLNNLYNSETRANMDSDQANKAAGTLYRKIDENIIPNLQKMVEGKTPIESKKIVEDVVGQLNSIYMHIAQSNAPSDLNSFHIYELNFINRIFPEADCLTGIDFNRNNNNGDNIAAQLLEKNLRLHEADKFNLTYDKLKQISKTESIPSDLKTKLISNFFDNATKMTTDNFLSKMETGEFKSEKERIASAQETADSLNRALINISQLDGFPKNGTKPFEDIINSHIDNLTKIKKSSKEIDCYENFTGKEKTIHGDNILSMIHSKQPISLVLGKYKFTGEMFKDIITKSKNTNQDIERILSKYFSNENIEGDIIGSILDDNNITTEIKDHVFKEYTNKLTYFCEQKNRGYSLLTESQQKYRDEIFGVIDKSGIETHMFKRMKDDSKLKSDYMEQKNSNSLISTILEKNVISGFNKIDKNTIQSFLNIREDLDINTQHPAISLMAGSEKPQEWADLIQNDPKKQEQNFESVDLINSQYSSSDNPLAYLFRRSYSAVLGVPGKELVHSSSGGQQSLHVNGELDKENIPKYLSNSINKIYEHTQESIKKHGYPKKLYRGLLIDLPFFSKEPINCHLRSEMVSTASSQQYANGFAGHLIQPEKKSTFGKLKSKILGEPSEPPPNKYEFESMDSLVKSLRQQGVNLTISPNFEFTGKLGKVQSAGVGSSRYGNEEEKSDQQSAKNIRLLIEQNDINPKGIFVIYTGKHLDELKSKQPEVKFAGNATEHVIFS